MRKAPAVVRNFRVAGLRGLLGVLVLCLITSAMMSPAARAAGSSIAIAANGPNPQPSGAPSSYTINFTCSSLVSQTCGTNPTITIPLDLTSSIPGTPDMSTWVYNSASSPAGLIQSASVQGENYVITLDPTQLQPGDSDEITLNVTPPNNITPDATTWSLTPSFASGKVAAIELPRDINLTDVAMSMNVWGYDTGSSRSHSSLGLSAGRPGSWPTARP